MVSIPYIHINYITCTNNMHFWLHLDMLLPWSLTTGPKTFRNPEHCGVGGVWQVDQTLSLLKFIKDTDVCMGQKVHIRSYLVMLWSWSQIPKSYHFIYMPTLITPKSFEKNHIHKLGNRTMDGSMDGWTDTQLVAPTPLGKYIIPAECAE